MLDGHVWIRAGLLLLSSSVALVGCASGAPASSGGEDDVTEASTEDALAANDLTATQSKLVLTLLDDHCGDAWCETDYDFRFERARCTFAAATCTVTMKIIDPSVKPAATYWRSCKLGHLACFADLVDTYGNGFQDLDARFFDRMTTCIDRVEDRLPRP